MVPHRLAESHAAVAHLVHCSPVLAAFDFICLKVAVRVKGLLLFLLFAVALSCTSQKEFV